jgi:hypothetical protein
VADGLYLTHGSKIARRLVLTLSAKGNGTEGSVPRELFAEYEGLYRRPTGLLDKKYSIHPIVFFLSKGLGSNIRGKEIELLLSNSYPISKQVVITLGSKFPGKIQCLQEVECRLPEGLIASVSEV